MPVLYYGTMDPAEVTAEHAANWEQRGRDPSGAVRTESTIDTGNPSLGNGNSIRSQNGLVVLGGYAFAGNRGVSAVELNIAMRGKPLLAIMS